VRPPSRPRPSPRTAPYKIQHVHGIVIPAQFWNQAFFTRKRTPFYRGKRVKTLCFATSELHTVGRHVRLQWPMDGSATRPSATAETHKNRRPKCRARARSVCSLSTSSEAGDMRIGAAAGNRKTAARSAVCICRPGPEGAPPAPETEGPLLCMYMLEI